MTAMNAATESVNDAFSLQKQISFRWHRLSSPIASSNVEVDELSNEKLLEVLVTLDEAHFEPEQQSDKEIVKEIKRLDAKLNLLLIWLGNSLIKQGGLPQRQNVSISSKCISFETNEKLALHEELFMELFFDPLYPQAFSAKGEVVSVEALGQNYKVQLVFKDLRSHIQDLLGRYIFKLHRKEVALSRKLSQQASE